MRGDREWSEVGRLWVMMEMQKEGSEVAPFPSNWRERAENCSRCPRGTPNQTPERGALGVPAPCAHRATARSELLSSRNSCRRRTSPRLAASILRRCRSRAGSGSPCPAGGSTQARSPARGSPGDHGAGSILPESHGARQSRGRRPPCVQTRLLLQPQPLLPHAHGAPVGAAHLLATQPLPPGCPPRAPCPSLAAPALAPARRSLRCPSALRGFSRVAVATRRRKSEPASERGRRGSPWRLWGPCTHSPAPREGES